MLTCQVKILMFVREKKFAKIVNGLLLDLKLFRMAIYFFRSMNNLKEAYIFP